MITQAVMDFASNFATWLLSLYPTVTIPSWFTGMDSWVNQIFSAVNGTSPWIPWPLVIGAGVVVLTFYLGALGFKLVLRVASYLPFIGGAG